MEVIPQIMIGAYGLGASVVFILLVYLVIKRIKTRGKEDFKDNYTN